MKGKFHSPKRLSGPRFQATAIEREGNNLKGGQDLSTETGEGMCGFRTSPPWRQPKGKWMVPLVNFHTNPTSKRWHLWEIDLRFALNSTPGWLAISFARQRQRRSRPARCRKKKASEKRIKHASDVRNPDVTFPVSVPPARCTPDRGPRLRSKF